MRKSAFPVILIFSLLLTSCGTSCAENNTANEGTESAGAAERKMSVECADGAVAYVTEETAAEGIMFSYLLDQAAVPELCIDYDGTDITVSTANGEAIQKIRIDLTADSAGNYIKFIDFNHDGYADVQFSSNGGTLNESYLIYLWDNNVEKLVPLICEFDEPLSYYEIYDGYVLNWVRGGASDVTVQTLVWTDETTLSLQSESSMKLDD